MEISVDRKIIILYDGLGCWFRYIKNSLINIKNGGGLK
jgi:hypothetical protein